MTKAYRHGTLIKRKPTRLVSGCCITLLEYWVSHRRCKALCSCANVDGKTLRLVRSPIEACFNCGFRVVMHQVPHYRLT
jgi:hypothetical protein